MAREYKLPYTAFEISDKLKMVDEVKTDLENNYYTRNEVNTTLEKITDIIEEVSNSADNANTSLNYKADLVDGKVPLEQLPDNIGGGGVSGEVAWEDIKNKPFEEISRGEKITWNGNTDGLTTISLDMPDMGATFVCCKLSDTILTKEQAMGKGFEAYSNGNTMPLSVDIVGGETPNGSFYMTNSDFGMPVIWMCSQADDTVVYDDGGMNITFTFPTTGLWFFALITSGSVYSRAVSFTIPENIKTLDIKYLPKNMALGYETKAFDDIIWDGNTEGLASTNCDVNMEDTVSFTYYKVSDITPTVSQVFDSVATILGADVIGVDEEAWLTDGGLVVTDTGSWIDSYSMCVAVSMNAGDEIAFEDMGAHWIFPEAGLYFLKTEMGGAEIRATSLTASNSIVQIDAKYLPTGQPNGIASLDDEGKVPDSQIRRDATVSENNNNLITSGAVYTALGNRSQLTIDDSVTSYSDNPVSSSAVYTAIENKKINVDSTVQSGSNNAVSSNAVYEAIQKGGVSVTSSDNGKFMRVVNGAWAAVAVPNAEDGEF